MQQNNFLVIFFFILISYPLLIFSQENLQDTIFIDHSGNIIENKQNAAYYRFVEVFDDNLLSCKEYYINNNKKAEYYILKNKKQLKHDKYISWYKNGEIEKQGEYEMGMKTGIWKKYYRDGKLLYEKEYKEKKYRAYKTVDKMPEFPGGNDSLYKYMTKNFKYPVVAKDNKIQGTVYIGFIINEKGQVSDVEIIKGIGGGCDEEALKIIKNMPDWTAGKQNGKAVPVYLEMPVNFKLFGN